MDLEDELRRLLRDDRLDIRTSADAEKNVVAGARRVRRNRVAAITTAGVLSAAVLAGGGFVLASGGPESVDVADEPPALTITSMPSQSIQPSSPTRLPAEQSTAPVGPTTSPTSTRRSPSDTAQPSASVVADLGPDRYDDLRLGMSAQQLTVTGKVPAQRPAVGACEVYGIEGMPDSSTLTVSKAKGLVAIELGSSVQTVAGAAIGMSQDQVKARHADLSGTNAQVSGNPNATYRFTFERNVVTRIALIANDQDCGRI